MAARGVPGNARSEAGPTPPRELCAQVAPLSRSLSPPISHINQSQGTLNADGTKKQPRFSVFVIIYLVYLGPPWVSQLPIDHLRELTPIVQLKPRTIKLNNVQLREYSPAGHEARSSVNEW